MKDGEFEAQRQADVRDERSTEELNPAARDRIFNEIVNEINESGDDVEMNVDIFRDSEANKDDQNKTMQVAKEIVGVMIMKDTDSHEEKCNYIVHAMDCMIMKKREKGTTEGVQKFNTLLGRWYSQAKKVSQEEGGVCRLEKGAVLRLRGDTREDPEYLLTYIVWKENG